MKDQVQHAITLDLASGARLKLLYFSDRELRWIFSYVYVRAQREGAPSGGKPLEIINETRFIANYTNGQLKGPLELSMHVEIPGRHGRKFFAGMDISPGAKTYLEFRYERFTHEYKLTEICKGVREHIRLDDAELAIVRLVTFPFPVPDRLPIELGQLRVPFRANTDIVAHFELPERTSL